MDELIAKAVKALDKNGGFNEITLSDGANTVHLVRYTPNPYVAPNTIYQPQIPATLYY